jgi:hypothetical protein
MRFPATALRGTSAVAGDAGAAGIARVGGDGTTDVVDVRARRIAEQIEPLRVEPGSRVNLAKDFDPDTRPGF